MRIVLDTNVLVAAMIRPYSVPAALVQFVLKADVELLADERILSEYGGVLSDPELDIDPPEARDVLDQLRLRAEMVQALPLTNPIPHAKDAPFIEVALAGKANAIVTGNQRHFPAKVLKGIAVLSPAQFLTRALAAKS
jgi:uncharacterized protein